MKKSLIKLSFYIIGLLLVGGGFLAARPAQAALELIKAQGQSAVYFLDSRGVRHAFPDGIAFKSWYGDSFSKVITVSADLIKTYPLGKNITIRPGVHLVKITTAPQVYAVEQGGVLREIENEDIAEAIYGKDWVKKVVDVPDVFFENYLIGEPLNHDYLLPNNILLQNKTTKKYYYKIAELIRPFESREAVLANNFKLSDAVLSSQSFYIRERPIAGRDKNIFNPAAGLRQDRRDCENKKLKAAVIFLADKEYLGTEIEAIQAIKEKISARFAEATDNFSSLDISYPTIIQLGDGYLLNKKLDGTTEIKNEAVNTFFDNNPDEFDFIFIWSNFKLPSEEETNEIAHFVPVTNKLEGIGRPRLDRAAVFGSQGKLKGVITMGNINKYHPETYAGLNESLNIVMHEVLHQWSAYIGFGQSNGQISHDLLRPDDLSHWNYYAGLISPLGGSGWQDNGDGTFTSALSQMADANLRNYSRLDLYLMGLIPYQLMDPVSYIAPKVPGALGNTLEATAQTVTIEQIIRANGRVECSAD